MKRNDGLQFARGVACLAVVFGHTAYFAGILAREQGPDSSLVNCRLWGCSSSSCSPAF